METVLNTSSNIEQRRNAYKALEGLELIQKYTAWDREDDTPGYQIDSSSFMAGHTDPDYLSDADLSVFLSEFEESEGTIEMPNGSQTLEDEPLVIETSPDEPPIVNIPEDEPLIVE